MLFPCQPTRLNLSLEFNLVRRLVRVIISGLLPVLLTLSTEESKRWIECLAPNGGCNVIKALRQVFKIKDVVDSILLILGSAYVYL